MSKLGDLCEQTSVTETYHRRGSGGNAPSRQRLWGSRAKPPEAGRLFGKTSYFNSIESHSARVLQPFEKPKFLHLKTK